MTPNVLSPYTGIQSLIRNSENRKAPKTESVFMEVDSNLNTTVTMTTITTSMYPLLQDPQARCNVPVLHVYVQVYSLVWACLCLKFYWMFYLEIKSTLVILWSVFIPPKINNAMNNIYQLVLISCAILSLSSWLLIPLTTIPKSEKFRFPKRVWSQGFRIRDCVPVHIVISSQVLFHDGSLLHSQFNTQLLITVHNSSRFLTHV
jgi:hypothetical protein